MSFSKNISGFGNVGFQLTGMDQVEQTIGRAIFLNKRPESVLRMIGGRMKKMIQENFTREENADGSKWEPLSEVTIALRRKGSGEGKPPEILRDTGRLKNSIAAKVEGDSVTVGTNVEYGPTHQFGQVGSGGWHGVKVDGKWVGEVVNNIPAREFVYIRDPDVEILVKMLTNELIIAAFQK